MKSWRLATLCLVTTTLVALTTATYASEEFTITNASGDNILINGDFEKGNLVGWQSTGTVTLVKDTLDSYTNNALHSVAGGQYAVRIGDNIPWGTSGPQASSISQEIGLPISLTLPETKLITQFSYAVVANDPPAHSESDKPAFRILIKDLTTSESLYDSGEVYTNQTSGRWYLGIDPNNDLSQKTFAFFGGDRWVFTGWQGVEVDVSDRIGHKIWVSFQVQDCNPSAHAAYGYLDNIRVGSPAPIVLPAIVGNPLPAVFLTANPFNYLFALLESLKLWPWSCCLCLLLPLLGLFAGRALAKRQTNTYYSPHSPLQESTLEISAPKPEERGIRPPTNKEPPKSGGGLRPPPRS